MLKQHIELQKIGHNKCKSKKMDIVNRKNNVKTFENSYMN